MFQFKFIIPTFRSYGMTATKDWFFRDWNLTRHKNFEVQIGRWDKMINVLELELDARLRGHDHAGIRFSFGVGPFYIYLNMYDDRHWNYNENRWFKPGEDDYEYDV